MQRAVFGLWILAAGVLLGGCRTHPDYAGDFRFPIMQGDIERGRQAFVDLGCHRCHTVDGVELAQYEGTSPLQLELGGELMFAKTYSALVTSIINPSHVLSDDYRDQMPSTERGSQVSPMPYHSQMTVSQLVDIVTFLNSSYRLLPGYSEEFYY